MGDFQQVLKVVSSPIVSVSTIFQPREYIVPQPLPVSTFVVPPPVIPVSDYIAPKTSVLFTPPNNVSFDAPILQITSATPSTFGLINPNLTMQTKDQPYYIPYSYLSSFLTKIPDPFTISTVNALTVNASTINVVSTFAKNVLTDYIEATEAYVYDKFTLDNQVITANATELLLNGNPIVTANQISSIADWSKDPAISTIQANGNDLTNVRFANFSSIVADGLTVVKLTTLFSTTIETFESTITAEIHKLTVSSITGGNGYFDVLTAGSIINPSASTINCQFLNVSSNANMLNATFSNAPTFNQGGTFNGTRPNFNTGINTSGPNNFNFTNIDNASNINGNVITISPQNNLNINTSNAVATVVDRGADVGGSAVIGLTARYGAGSQINLNANSASIYSPTPASAINLDAQGNVSYLSGIPFGGAVNISARAGLSGTGTSVAGGGGINLTAYSYGALAPGTIKESAGSILSYSGLTVPSVGVLGSGFYSALNCLSLTAGASPATTSYPGVVYLRGDNGTKVVNGFYADTITATGNSVLPTITGVTAINGSAYPPTSGSGVWCSTATTALNMNGFDINNAGIISSSNVYAGSAVIGTPSAFGSSFAYFGNKSLASNGTEYALIQSDGGETLLNAKVGTLIRFRVNNTDTMTMDALGLNMNQHTLNGLLNTYWFGGNIIGSTSGGGDGPTYTISAISNLYLNGPSGIYLNGPITANSNLNMNNNNINNVSFQYFKNGGYIESQTNSYLDINGANNGVGNLRLRNGGGEFQVLTTGGIYANPLSGQPILMNGYVDMNNHNINNVANLTGSGGYLNISANYGIVIQNTVGTRLAFNTDGSFQVDTTGTNQTSYFNGNMTFNGTNRYINSLGHIYGDPSAPGGGLSIDGMFGMFFNSAGHDANLFIDSGGLHMLNNTTFIDINAVNSDVYIGAGRTINLNATTGANMNSGGASIQIAGDNNIYFTANGGGGTTRYANFQETNVAFNTGTPGSLGIYMNGNNIRNVGDLTRNLGSAVVSQPVIQYGTDGTGSGPSGSVTVTIPNTYTSKTTYVVQVTMRDAPSAQLYATPITGNTFTIGWTSAGAGTQNIMWVTFGT